MTKKEIENQIDLLIKRINNPQNSIIILKPLVEDIYRFITNNQNFYISDHLSIDIIRNNEQNQRREMVQLLEGIKEQLDLFIQEIEIIETKRGKLGYLKGE